MGATRSRNVGWWSVAVCLVLLSSIAVTDNDQGDFNSLTESRQNYVAAQQKESAQGEYGPDAGRQSGRHKYSRWCADGDPCPHLTGVHMVMPGRAFHSMQGMQMRGSSSPSTRPGRSGILLSSSSSANGHPLSMLTTSSPRVSDSHAMQVNSNRNNPSIYPFSEGRRTKRHFDSQNFAIGNYSVKRMDSKNRFFSDERKGRRFRRYTSQSTSHNNSEISEALQLLDEGTTKIQLRERDITLVLGNTGAGKSTFLQWVAGDNDKLIATETGPGTGEYLIADGNRISNSTLDSMTIFPELVSRPGSNDAYYDCPGFSDTRSSSMEIAITYFIKQVADYAERVKLVFVVNYSSVKKLVDRQDFMKLLGHATDLIKDVDRYQHSIAIVVTKIDNRYYKGGGMVPDKVIVESEIVVFLEECKQWLIKQLGDVGVSGDEKIFYGQALKFVKTLLIKNGEQFSRIGLFRRPDEPGPLSNITLLIEGKKHVEKILNENLAFTATNDGDFGYTTSDRSKLFIGALIEGINNNVWSNFRTLADDMEKHYRHFVEGMGNKIRSFSNATEHVDVDPLAAHSFLHRFHSGQTLTANLIQEVTNITSDQLAEKINNSLSNLGINGFAQALQSISQQGKYFEFMKVVSGSGQSSRSRAWGDLLQPVAKYLSDSKGGIQKDIYDTAREIVNQQQTIISGVAENIKKHYQSKMRSMVIQQLPAEMYFGHASIQKMIHKMEHSNTTLDLSIKLREVVSEAATYKIRQHINHVLTLEKRLTFLKIISNETLVTSTSSQFITSLNKTAVFLRESQAWYEFLTNLYEKFSKYDVQSNRSKYNVANMLDWGQENKPQRISVTEKTFTEFIEKIEQFNVTGYNEIKNITADERRVEELRQVAVLTLDSRLHAPCQSDKLTIKGDYIRLSEAIVHIWNCNCSTIEIFALNKIFVDENLNRVGKKLKLIMIAPTWEIIGYRDINLSGTDGKNQSKAERGKEDGGRGADGKPGLPGGPAGSFLGVGATFLNGNMLRIAANGGTGGNGQDGGDGARGRHGSSPITNEEHYSKNYKCDNLCVGGEWVPYPTTSAYELYGMMGVFPCKIHRYTRFFHNDVKWEFDIYGEHGRKGGDGGDGGRIGSGGKSGDIKIITLGNTSSISSINNNGRDGTVVGKGGKGGAVGEYEKISVYIECFRGIATGARDYFANFELKAKTRRNPINFPIINGRDGRAIGAQHPEPAAVIGNKIEIINEYKRYVRENLHFDVGGQFRANNLNSFVNGLDRNSEVIGMYDTSIFLKEMLGLEEQFQKLSQRDLLPLYQSLSDRISKYAEHIGARVEFDEQKTLAYLYTAALAKLYFLKSKTDEILIMNVREYLDLTMNNVNTLEKLEEKANKVRVINDYKTNYTANIGVKIEESRRFIEKEIKPDIDQLHERIDDKIDSLLTEIKELQRDAIDKRDELLEKKKALEQTAVLRGLFSFFKIIGQVAGLLGPAGAAVGSIIGGASSVTEAFVLDDQTAQQQSLKALPEGVMAGVRFVEAEVKSVKDLKVTRNNHILDNITQEIDPHPLLKDVSESIKKIRNQNGAPGPEEPVAKIKEELKAKKIELSTNRAIDDESAAISRAIGAIDKVQCLIQISTVTLDIYSKHKNDQAKLDSMDYAIQQAEEQLQILKQHENKVYGIITPALDNMKKDLDEVISALSSKSQVALDVTNWKVQGMLRDLKLFMHQFTEGFKVEENLVRCIEKLEESMTTLIHLYDRIQDYQQQQNLANYIAAVAAPHGPDNVDQVQLEILIRSNLILQQYKTAVNALKQSVFPFAGFYLEAITLPSHFEISYDNITYTASKATKQIEHIKKRIGEYMTAIQHHDRYIYEGSFDSHHNFSLPFFVWRNEEHKNVIFKLLSGEAVVVKADVRFSESNKDAIKSKSLEINLKVRNATKQAGLNDKLRWFMVSATHCGNSYYRYDGKLYVIHGPSSEIIYSFGKDANGVPIDKNQVYSKIKAGDFMLSPYAMWKIQLIPNRDGINFNQLLTYRNEVDLELVGSGRYVKKGANMPNLNVEKYYRADDALLFDD